MTPQQIAEAFLKAYVQTASCHGWCCCCCSHHQWRCSLCVPVCLVGLWFFPHQVLGNVFICKACRLGGYVCKYRHHSHCYGRQKVSHDDCGVPQLTLHFPLSTSFSCCCSKMLPHLALRAQP